MSPINNVRWPTTRTLYPYQTAGVTRIAERGYGFIWDDPGLGKTTQALVAARSLSPAGPWLIICPNSLKSWWRKEIIQLFPEDRKHILVSTVGGRFPDPDTPYSKDEILPHFLDRRGKIPRWVVTHYTGVRISEASYAQINWTGVILDEAHYIKNPKARRTAAVMKITPDYAYRIGLTATPFGVNPADLWSQLHWMAPQVQGLKSYWRFFNIFVDYTWEKIPAGGRYRKISGGKNLELLGEVMHAYGIQRTKKEVAPQLPPVTHTDMPLELSSRQEIIYNALKEKDRVELVIKHTDEQGKTDPNAITGLLIKNTLSRLTQMERWLSCPWEFDPGTKGAKLEWIIEWAASYSLPAVIATRFRSSAQRIAKELTGKCERAITGKLPLKFREPILDNWRGGKFQFLVGTIGTLGVGLNLQPAHQMICYDQVYSSIQMEQLYQRVHRIDSDHPVEIVYLCVEDTSNMVILQSFRERWNQMQLVRSFLQHLREGETK